MEHVEVCVVGGGIAGLSAVTTLLTHEKTPLDKQDVFLIEAQAQFGGRIVTERNQSKLGNHYDLGASWFHDSLTNQVLWKLVEDGDFEVGRDGEFNDRDPQVWCSGDEDPVDMVGLKVNRVVEEMEKFIEMYYFQDGNKQDMSLKDIVQLYMAKYGGMLLSQQKMYCETYMRYYESWVGITWDKLSSKHLGMDFEGRNLYNCQGYDLLVAKLLQQIPEERTRLNFPLRRIWRDNGENAWRYRLDAPDGRKIYCNYVILTVPQSILSLKPDSQDPQAILWEPPLPKTTRKALQNVHFGALGKCILEFTDIWWDNSFDSFEVLADSHQNSNEIGDGELKMWPPVFSLPTHVVNLSSMESYCKNGGGVLCILTQSPLTLVVESRPHEAWAYFKPILAKIARKNSTILDPITTITSNWTVNPYIRGSYPATHVGDDPIDSIIHLNGDIPLTLTGHPHIRFAGDHTIAEGSGCVHGAFASGQREATWIINDRTS